MEAIPPPRPSFLLMRSHSSPSDLSNPTSNKETDASISITTSDTRSSILAPSRISGLTASSGSHIHESLIHGAGNESTFVPIRQYRRFGRSASSSIQQGSPIALSLENLAQEAKKKLEKKKENRAQEALNLCKLCHPERLGIGMSDSLMDIQLIKLLSTKESKNVRNMVLNIKNIDDLYGTLASNQIYLSKILLPDAVPNLFYSIANYSEQASMADGIEECAIVTLEPMFEATSKSQSSGKIPLSKLCEYVAFGIHHIKSLYYSTSSQSHSSQLTAPEARACRWAYRLSSWSLIGSIVHYIIDKLFSSPSMMVTLNKIRIPINRPTEILIKPMNSPKKNSLSQYQICIDIKGSFAFDIHLLTHDKVEICPLIASVNYAITITPNSADINPNNHHLNIECLDLKNIPVGLYVTDSIDANVDGIYIHDGFKDGAGFYINHQNGIGIMRTLNNNSISWTLRKLKPISSKRGQSTKYKAEKILFKWESTKTKAEEFSRAMVPPSFGWNAIATMSLPTSPIKEAKLRIECLKNQKEMDDLKEMPGDEKSSPNLKPTQNTPSKGTSSSGTHISRPSSRFGFVRQRSKFRKGLDLGNDDDSISKSTSPSPLISQSPAPHLTQAFSEPDLSLENDSDLGLPILTNEMKTIEDQVTAGTYNTLLNKQDYEPPVFISKHPQISPRYQVDNNHNQSILNHNPKSDQLKELKEIFASMQIGENEILSSRTILENKKHLHLADEEKKDSEFDDITKPLLYEGWSNGGDVRPSIPPRSTCDIEDEDEDSARSWIQLHRWLSRAIHLRKDEFDKVSSIDTVGEGLDCKYDIRLMGCPADTMKKQFPFQVCAHAIILSPARLTYLHSIGVTSVYVSARLVCNGRPFPCVPQETPKINLQEVLMMGSNTEGGISTNAKKNSLTNRFLRFKRRESDDPKKNNPNTTQINELSPVISQLGRKKGRNPLSGGLAEMVLPSSSVPTSLGNDNTKANGNDNETIDDASNTDDGVDDRSELEAEAASITEGESSGVLLWGSKGWLAWSESIAALGRLPPSTRVVFTLYGVVSNTWHNGPTKFAVGSIQAFDPLHCARSGNVSIRMWPLRDIGQASAKSHRQSFIPLSMLLPSEDHSNHSLGPSLMEMSDASQNSAQLPSQEDMERKSESIASLLSSRAHRPPRSIRELKNIAKICETGKEWVGQPRRDEEFIKILVRFPKYSRPIFAAGSLFNPKDISTTTYSTVERHANFHASCADVSFISEKAINIAISEGLTMDQLNNNDPKSGKNDTDAKKSISQDLFSIGTSSKDGRTDSTMSASEGFGVSKKSSLSSSQPIKKSRKRKSAKILKSKPIPHDSDLLLPQEKFVAERESRRQLAYIHVQRAIWEKQWNKLTMRAISSPSPGRSNFHPEVRRIAVSTKDKVAMNKASSDFRCPRPLSIKESVEFVARGLDDASEALNALILNDSTKSSTTNSDNINVIGVSSQASMDEINSPNLSSYGREHTNNSDAYESSPMKNYLPRSPSPPHQSLSNNIYGDGVAVSSPTLSKSLLFEKLSAILSKSEDQRSLAELATIWECRHHLSSREDWKTAIISSALMVPHSLSSVATPSYATLLGATPLSGIGSSTNLNNISTTQQNSLLEAQVQDPLSLDPRKRIELRKLFEIWASLDIKTALSILENRFFDDIEIRSYAVSSIGALNDHDLFQYMERLLDCLKLEQFHDSYLARILVWRSLCPESGDIVGASLIKSLYSRVSHDDGYSSRYSFLLDALLVICPIERAIKWIRLADQNFPDLDELPRPMTGGSGSISRSSSRSIPNSYKRVQAEIDNQRGSNESNSQITMTPSRSLASLISTPETTLGRLEERLQGNENPLAEYPIEIVSTFQVPESNTSHLSDLLNTKLKFGMFKKKSTNGIWQARMFATKSNERALYYWPIQKNGDYDINNATRIDIPSDVNISINHTQVSIKSKKILEQLSGKSHSSSLKRRGSDTDVVSRTFSTSSRDSMTSNGTRSKRNSEYFQYELRAETPELALEWYEHLKKLLSL